MKESSCTRKTVLSDTYSFPLVHLFLLNHLGLEAQESPVVRPQPKSALMFDTINFILQRA